MSTQTITISESGDTLPTVNVLTGRGFITGKSDSGKSNTASVIIEELLSKGHAMLIVDTDGEYYGLKEQFEILHVGADETCDLQVGPEHAERLAEIALRQNVPVILDVSGYLDDEEARTLIRETCRALFDLEHELRRPFAVFVEEVHEYLPEGPGLDETGKTLVRIAKRGRKRGLGLCGISQRPADVKKDFITQCNYLFWHRLTWDNDTAVVRRVAGSEAAGEVDALSDGEALVMADFLEEHVRRVQVRRKETFDAGATPDLSDEGQRPALKSVSAEILEELKEISERQRRRLDELERVRLQLAEREQRIEELEEELERQQDVAKLANRLTDALSRTGSAGSEEVNSELRQALDETQEALRQMRSERDDLERKLAEAEAHTEELKEKAEQSARLERIGQHLPDLQEAIERLADGLGLELGSDEKLRERARHQQQRIEDLERRLKQARQRTDGVALIDPDVETFLQDEHVRRGIRQARKDATPRYVDGIIRALVETERPVTYDQVANKLGISNKSHISTAANALQRQGVVRLSGSPRNVRLHLEGLAEMHQQAARRQRTSELMSNL